MVHNWKTPRQKLHGKHMKTQSTIFFRQLCLVLGMMEINSNLSSKYCDLVVRETRVTMHQPSKDPMSRAKLRHPIHTIYGGSILLNNVRNVRNPLFMYRDFYIYLHDWHIITSTSRKILRELWCKRLNKNICDIYLAVSSVRAPKSQCYCTYITTSAIWRILVFRHLHIYTNFFAEVFSPCIISWKLNIVS